MFGMDVTRESTIYFAVEYKEMQHERIPQYLMYFWFKGIYYTMRWYCKPDGGEYGRLIAKQDADKKVYFRDKQWWHKKHYANSDYNYYQSWKDLTKDEWYKCKRCLDEAITRFRGKYHNCRCEDQMYKGKKYREFRDELEWFSSTVCDLIRTGVEAAVEVVKEVKKVIVATCKDNFGFEEVFEVGMTYPYLGKEEKNNIITVENMLGEPVKVFAERFTISEELEDA